MIDNFDVLLLRTEQNNFCILIDLYSMAGRPVKKVTAVHGVLRSVAVCDDDLAFDQVSPMRRLAKITFESFEQWSNVGAGGQREVFAREFPETYRTQTGPDGPWPPLSPVTQEIRAYYGHPPEGPALVRGGDLLQSITTLALEAQSVTVGTRLPFASTLQEGGTVTHPRTGTTRTVQAFPFAYVTAQEVQNLAASIQEYYFGAHR